MTQPTRELAASSTRGLAGTSSRGYEYHLRAPVASEFGDPAGGFPPSELQQLEASDVQARSQWRRTLLAVRRALSHLC